MLDIGATRLTRVVNLLERASTIEVTGEGDLRPAPGGPVPEAATTPAAASTTRGST